jgi:hypothetical protein
MSFIPLTFILASLGGVQYYLTFDRYEVAILTAAILTGILFQRLRMPRIGDFIGGSFLVTVTIVVSTLLAHLFSVAGALEDGKSLLMTPVNHRLY